jgi:hypothetical protein
MSENFNNFIKDVKVDYALKNKKLPPYSDNWPWNVPDQELEGYSRKYSEEVYKFISQKSSESASES